MRIPLLRLGVHNLSRIILSHKNYLVTTGYCEQQKNDDRLEVYFTYNQRSYRMSRPADSLLATCEIVPPQTSGYANDEKA
jgi:hypothetical protein